MRRCLPGQLRWKSAWFRHFTLAESRPDHLRRAKVEPKARRPDFGRLWISGDTVLYDGVRGIAARLEIDTAILHLGGVRFAVTGPVRYTMAAQDAVELCRLIRPGTAIPIHYEGWKHFKQRREDIEREFARAPEDIRRAIRWLPIGAPVEAAASAAPIVRSEPAANTDRTCQGSLTKT
jgi:hypothetical protein